jgi:dTDP-glucose 4,6-dehydratase
MERTIRWYLDNQSWWRPLKSGDYWEYYRRNYRPLELDLSR